MRETEFSPNPSQELADVEAITCVNSHYRTSYINPFEAFLMGDSPLSQPLKGGYAQGVEPDLIQELLNDKRSPNTKRAYARDLKDFFRVIALSQPTPELVTQFLQLDRFKAMALVLKYKANLLERQLSEASVNRRLAAVKSLVKFARKIGKCDFTLEDVEGEKIRSYRDTTGISPTAFKKMLLVPNRKTLKGKRDYAILHLLWSNGLRRAEVSQARIKDFDPLDCRLWILGKGKGTQKEGIDLNQHTVTAILDWLQNRRELNPSQPLFISLSHWQYGHQLTGKSIYEIVRQVAKAAGISKVISPHRIRHSAITALLDNNGGNTRQAQQFSRHASADTLRKYDDNRMRLQGEASDLLADLL